MCDFSKWFCSKAQGLSLVVLVLITAFNAMADSFRQVELRYRQALSLQQTLAPLMSDKVALVAEGNVLILRGPTDELNQLVAIIKKLDKPQQQLQVSLFRGEDPSTESFVSNSNFNSQKRSTHNGEKNRLDHLVMIAGETLVITEQEWLLVPLQQSVISDRYVDVEGGITPNRHNAQFNAYSNSQALLSVESRVELSAVIVKDSDGKERVSVTSLYSLPTKLAKEGVLSTSAEALKTQTSSRLVKLNQWQLLSSQSQHSEPVDYSEKQNKRSQIFSTSKKDEFDYKVWVRFSLI